MATNAFLTKIQWNGTNASIGYSAVFGGYGIDEAQGVALDPNGNVFVAGSASSTNFPVTAGSISGFLRTTNSGSFDAFVTAFNTNGSALLFSAYLGGKDSDYAHAIAIDPAGSAYVTGQTLSTNFPTLNAGQSLRNGTNDTFLAKIIFTNQPPVLNIGWDGTNVLLSRSAFLTEYTLEGSPNLISNIWGSVGAESVLTNGLQITTFPITNYDQVFFRLHKF